MGFLEIGVGVMLLAAGVPGPNAREGVREAGNCSAGRVYYVDALEGDDENGGNSPERAWKSIGRVNEAVLGPGDRVLLAGGQVFAGTLRIDEGERGKAGAPIVIGSFGRGRATIDSGDGDGVIATRGEHLVIRDLEIVGSGRKTGNDGAGIRLGGTKDVTIDGIGVRGFRLGGVSGGGEGGEKNLRITRVHARENGHAGIAIEGEHLAPRSEKVYIGYCVAENNAGDPKNLRNHSGNGIVIGGANRATIEHCRAFENGWDMPRQGNGPVGIWGYECDRLTIQRCISHDNKSPSEDGGGFDLDGGVTNSVMQQNLSFNNGGVGYLLCQYEGASAWKGNVVRYNVSINDGRRRFHAGIGLWVNGEGFSDGLVHHNVIVNPRFAIHSIGDVPRMTYRNNLFLTGTNAKSGEFSGSRFEKNIAWSAQAK